MSQEFSAQICAGGGDALRYVGHDGAYETHVRAHRAQFSSTALCQRLNVIMTSTAGKPMNETTDLARYLTNHRNDQQPSIDQALKP